MEVIILDKKTFSIKEYLVCDSFEVIKDLILTQKSNFKINSEKVLAEVKDFVYIRHESFYFGIIESIEKEEGFIKLFTVDFKELLKKEIVVKTYSGNIGNFLEEKIRETLINNSDQNQNLPFLSISLETTKIGSFLFEDDKVMTIYELFDLAYKMYGITLDYKVVILNGNITNLELRIVSSVENVILKADDIYLDELNINNSNKEGINKVIYHPKEGNIFFKDIKEYYLLKDGSVTNNKDAANRYLNVLLKVETYSDNDYLDLDQKARQILTVSKEDHQITFKTNLKTNSLKVIRDLKLGHLVEFLYKGKVYSSVVSGLTFTDSFDLCLVTLGEYRLKLTEKIQILSENVKSNVGNVTITNQGFSDLDGGEF